MLILLVPVIGFIVMLLFTISESRPGPNRYGADPRLLVVGQHLWFGQVAGEHRVL